MSKVCYIHPSGETELPSHWVMPAGIFGILQKLHDQGFMVSALNYPMEKVINKRFDFVKWIRDNPCEYYMIGMHWYVHSKNALELVHIIRKEFPKSIIIVGGLTASLYYKNILTDLSGIDYLIKGDGERPIVELIQALENHEKVDHIPNVIYKKNNKLHLYELQYQMKDFGGLSYHNIQFLYHYKFYPFFSYPRMLVNERSLWLVNGRGCLYDCSGCDGRKNGKYSKDNYSDLCFIKRSVDDVCKDINEMLKYKLDYIKLTHDICSYGNEYCEALFRYLEKVNIKLYNECWQLPNEMFFDILKKYKFNQNIELAVTVHSGDERLRKFYGKFYSNENLIHTIKVCIRNNIKLKLFFSRFLPTEKKETLERTYILITQIKELNVLNNVDMIYEPYIVDPFSKVKSSDKENEFESILNYIHSDMVQKYPNASDLWMIDKKILNIMGIKNEC